MTHTTRALPVDAAPLRDEVKEKYRAVAVSPNATYHFHTGRGAAARCGYDPVIVDALPDRAVESFAGVANPLRPPSRDGLRLKRRGSAVVFTNGGVSGCGVRRSVGTLRQDSSAADGQR
jgi:hypothetical protein